MTTVLLPNISRPHPDLCARRWAWGVLVNRNVHTGVIRSVMRRCRITVHDFGSTSGGGLCHWAQPHEKFHVELFTAQEEACVHEFAHLWLHVLREKREADWRAHVDALVAAMLAEAKAAPGDFPRIRKLCRDYRWGVGSWAGMWMTDAGRWDRDEIWAGLASGSMGDLSLYPPRLRGLYGRFYHA